VFRIGSGRCYVNGAVLSAIGGMFPTPYLPTDSAAFWFMMQVGFAATYPVNWWLIRRGIKDIMRRTRP
jgi:hypothetical protein